MNLEGLLSEFSHRLVAVRRSIESWDALIDVMGERISGCDLELIRGSVVYRGQIQGVYEEDSAGMFRFILCYFAAKFDGKWRMIEERSVLVSAAEYRLQVEGSNIIGTKIELDKFVIHTDGEQLDVGLIDV